MYLDWMGPYEPEWFLRSKSPIQEPGVYLWIGSADGDSWIDYVGKAEGSPTIGKRQQEHFANIIGLRATIPAQFRKSRTAWIPNQYPDNANDLVDPGRYTKLIDEAREYLSALEVYVAILSRESKQQIRTIERNLLFSLRPAGTKRGTITPPNETISIIHRNATWATKRIIESASIPPIVA